MSESLGRSTPMSLGRRIICDMMTASMKIPLVSIQKEMNVAELAAARQLSSPRPSWCSIFTKAYGKVAATHAELRRSCLTFPWLRIFESTAATADIAMHARIDGEDVVVFVPLREPEKRPLLEIDQILAACRENPLERLGRYRRTRFLARFPTFLRRLAWWYYLNVSGSKRTRYVGTFGMVTVGNWGADSLRPIAPCTTLLHYGAIDAQCNLTMRLTFDHRVLDGVETSRALNELERVLKTEILDELHGMASGGDAGLRKAG